MKALFCHSDFEPKPGYVLDEYEKTTGKMRAGNMAWRNPRLELTDIPEPTKVGPRDVKLHVKACGICGSDMHFIESTEDGYMLYPGHVRLNIVLGHEFCGEIVEVGSDVHEFKVGDLVVPEEMVWCGECIPCRNGYPNQCEHLEELGVTCNGGFEPFCVVPARVCWKIDALREVFGDKVYQAGACIEPSSVAYRSLFPIGGGIKPGAFCVVHGGGPIGLLATGLLKAAGAAKVIVFEISEGRREVAKKMGADVVLDPTQYASARDQATEILKLTDGFGADLQLEAAGVPKKTMPVILESTAIGGTVIQTAYAAGETPMYLPAFQNKAIKLVGSMGHSGNGTFQHVIRLMASGKFDPTPIISATFPLSRGMEAFDLSFKRIGAKVMIDTMDE